MNKNLKNYIRLKYGEYSLFELTEKDVEIIRKSYGFALYDLSSNVGEVLDKIESELNPALLNTAKCINKIIKRFKK